jgi:serine/threonine-protein kinase
MVDDDYHPTRRRGPGWAGVILASLIVSLLTSFATAIYVEKKGLAWLDGGATDAPAEPVQVPDVVGMTPEAADELLAGRGLRLVVREEEPSADVPEGEIAGQAPLAGSRVDPGERVDVVVSTGAPLIAIPPVVGRPLTEAQLMLTSAGLSVGRVSETGEGEPGTVTETNPPQGTSTTPDTPVALIVVPAGVEVPDLVGKSHRQARQLLEAAGLREGRVRRRYDENRGPYVVLEQTPAAGTRHPPNGDVELVVNEGD